MIKKILIGLAVVLIGFVALVLKQPAQYTITRSVIITSSPQYLFPYINNPKKMDEWHPFKDIDPTAKVTYSGPMVGKGAKTEWQDGAKMGTGSSTLIDVVNRSYARAELEFVKPFQMKQLSEIKLEPKGKRTQVTWTVTGENNFVGRAFCLFSNMDKMVGGMFEKSLNQLKTIAEKREFKR